MKFQKVISFLKRIKKHPLARLFLNIAIMLLIGVLLVFLFFYVSLPVMTNKGKEISVPNLEGMHYDELDEFLGKRNLRFEVSDSAYSSVYPALTVLKQYPLSGNLVKEGRVIYLTVKAREPQKVQIPNQIIHKSLKSVEMTFKSLGLKIGEISYKPNVALNAILELWHEDEEIAPGDIIAKGSVIDLVVGDGFGKSTFALYDYTGQPFEFASAAIKAHNLELGTVIVEVLTDEEYFDLDIHDGYLDSVQLNEPGIVIKQYPPEGNKVSLGTIVDIWVAASSEEDSLQFIEELEGLEIEEE